MKKIMILMLVMLMGCVTSSINPLTAEERYDILQGSVISYLEYKVAIDEFDEEELVRLEANMELAGKLYLTFRGAEVDLDVKALALELLIAKYGDDLNPETKFKIDLGLTTLQLLGYNVSTLQVQLDSIEN